jgi:Ca2+-transporting ATPase
MRPWYQSQPEAVVEHFDSNVDRGLQAADAAQRLEEYGHNEITEQKGQSPWKILWEQFSSIIVLILVAAAFGGL